MDLQAVRSELESRADSRNLAGMARFGMNTTGRLGISMPELRALGKSIGRDHELAIELWRSGVAEAHIVAGLIADPLAVTDELMEEWVRDFDSWDVCDQVCMNLFDRSPLAWQKIFEWAVREEEFVRRAAFALIASLAVHDKKSGDERFAAFLPVIEGAAQDERNFVKKAVNWALRGIGKRSLGLNELALQCARQLQQSENRTACWIARDAIRELESTAVQERLQKRTK
ncbi:DNA alkylation repair protein [candidate division KSB1 bacterium]|nr:DNA alkylation repair protein [candidate division KSB1 bacterium]